MIGPRIQGKVGQVEEPPEFKGKWSYCIWISVIGSDKDPIELQAPGCWDTKELALLALREKAKELVKDINKIATGKESEEFYDLNAKKNRDYGKLEYWRTTPMKRTK